MSSQKFGARYGPKLKKKFALIEAEQRAKHQCPYCQKKAVKRLALGLWQCLKCRVKFAGKAYTP